MSRRVHRFTADSAELPLFPVLTVLLAAVGVLCFLLLVVVRQAMLTAASDERLSSLRTARQRLQETLAALTAERQRLSLRQERQHAALRAAVEQRTALEHAIKSARDNLSALRATASALRTELTAKAEQAERLRKLLASRPQKAHRTPPLPRWRVMLEPSPHGRSKTPVFLHCRAHGVVLEPYGVRFEPAEFLAPGIGRSAFQQAIHALLRRLAEAGVHEPYPLLIVRPDGIQAFYVAADQLHRLGIAFGYELIEPNKRLDFEPIAQLPASELASIVQRARDAAARASNLAGRLPVFEPLRLGPGGTAHPAIPPAHTSHAARHRGQEAAGTRPVPNLPSPGVSTGACPPRAAPSSLRRALERSGVVDLLPRRRLAARRPTTHGTWKQSVPVLVARDALVLAGRALPSAPLEEAAERVLWLAEAQARPGRPGSLLLLEVQPELDCYVAPDGVQRYWGLRWQLARAGISTRFLLLNAWETATLEALLLGPHPPQAGSGG